jgi:hypothetical protein
LSDNWRTHLARTTEGVGKVPPRPVKVRITTADLRLAQVVTVKRNRIRGYKSRSDQWGRGSLKTCDPVLVGTVGEIAFAHWCNHVLGLRLELDDADRMNGDYGVDFVIEDAGGVGVQVKTAHSQYSELLIKCPQLNDCLTSNKWQACVRAHWPPRDEPGNRLAVWLCGWVRPMEAKLKGEYVPSWCKKWWNYRVSEKDFNQMSLLADNLDSLRWVE